MNNNFEIQKIILFLHLECYKHPKSINSMFGLNTENALVDALNITPRNKNGDWSNILSTSLEDENKLKKVEEQAYQRGLKEADKNKEKELSKIVNNNLKSSTELLKILIHESNSVYKIKFKQILLRIMTPKRFDFLILVKTEDFIKDEFLKIYSITKRIKKENNNQNLDASFNFLPIKSLSEVNKNRIVSDGYYLKYGGESPKKAKNNK